MGGGVGECFWRGGLFGFQGDEGGSVICKTLYANDGDQKNTTRP